MATFRMATPDDTVEQRERTTLLKPDLPSLHAYIGLKALFGDADRDNIDDFKQQWVYALVTDGALLEVYDWKLDSWSIAVWESQSNSRRAEALAQDLVTQVTRVANQHQRTIAATTQSPIGHVIDNPFALYLDTATDLLDMAIAARANMKEITNLGREYSLCRGAFFQFVAAIEGMLNLIYEVFLKPELRDERLLARIIRENIDVKLRLAPVYCTCFSKSAIDHTTDAYKDFLRLVDLRNDFIHANITKSMKAAVIYHDDITFVVSPAASPANSLIPPLVSQIGVGEAQRVHQVVIAIADQILSSMKPRVRSQFREVMVQEYVQVGYEKGAGYVVRGPR